MTTGHARRSTFALGILLLASTVTTSARATDPSLAQCYDAHEEGQIARKNGKLLKARQSFAVCGRRLCPSIVQKDCVAWAEELATQQPTVVIAVVRSDGTDVLGARVFIDGASTAADGHGVELDPGEHRVRVEGVGPQSFDRSFAVREGDRSRRVAIVLPAEPVTRRAAPPLPSYVLGGVAALALGSFGTFAVIGKSRENELTDSCHDRCSDAQVASVRRSYVTADVSLGIGVVSAAVATALWLLAPSRNTTRTVSGSR